MGSEEEIKEKLNLLIGLWEDFKTEQEKLDKIVIPAEPGPSDARAMSEYHQKKVDLDRQKTKAENAEKKLTNTFNELAKTCANKSGGKINALKKQTRSRGKSMKRGKSVKMRQT